MRIPGASFFSAKPGELTVGDGLKCAPLGFGTWAWGNKLLWGYDEAADATLQKAFEKAVGGGGKRKFFFDTGDSYGTGALEGRAESLLGEFRSGLSQPDRCVIGTKLAVYPTRVTGAQFEAACRSSLKRMGRDQIELVQAHWSAKNFQPWQEPALWDGLARCHEAGLCRAVGTSNFGPKQLRKVNAYWRDRGVPHSVNQVQLSLLSTLPMDSGLLDECRDLGVTPIGYSPLALGVLSGKYSKEKLPSGPRSILFKELLPSLAPLLGTLDEVATSRDVSMSAVAVNWAMSKGALVIVGMKTPEQVADNLMAATFKLSGAEVDELERAALSAKPATQNIFQTS